MTLKEIRDRVRVVTGRPTVEQIADATLDKYINVFYQYMLPLELELEYTYIQTPPAALNLDSDEPLEAIWSEFIVYGASLRIFFDNGESEAAAINKTFYDTFKNNLLPKTKKVYANKGV